MKKKKTIPALELRASKIHGVGVFTYKRIRKDEKLPLFDKEDNRFIKNEKIRDTGIPFKLIEKYSIWNEDGYSAPKSFNRMSIGWYLNHSDNSNLYRDEDYNYYARRTIGKDEELTIDYEEL